MFKNKAKNIRRQTAQIREIAKQYNKAVNEVLAYQDIASNEIQAGIDQIRRKTKTKIR